MNQDRRVVSGRPGSTVSRKIRRVWASSERMHSQGIKGEEKSGGGGNWLS